MLKTKWNPCIPSFKSIKRTKRQQITETEAAFLDILATFHIPQKVNYAALVGMQDFLIQIMLQMYLNICICVAAQYETF